MEETDREDGISWYGGIRCINVLWINCLQYPVCIKLRCTHSCRKMAFYNYCNCGSKDFIRSLNFISCMRSQSLFWFMIFEVMQCTSRCHTVVLSLKNTVMQRPSTTRTVYFYEVILAVCGLGSSNYGTLLLILHANCRTCQRTDEASRIAEARRIVLLGQCEHGSSIHYSELHSSEEGSRRSHRVVFRRSLFFYKLIIITCILYTAIVECGGTTWIRILRVGESAAGFSSFRLCVSVLFVVFTVIYLHCERYCRPTQCERYSLTGLTLIEQITIHCPILE